jgi:hypothetical protein
MYKPCIGEPMYVPPFADQPTRLPFVTIRTLPYQNITPWFEFHEMDETGDVVVNAPLPEVLFDDTSPTTYWALCKAGATRLRLGYAFSGDERYLAGLPVYGSDEPMLPYKYMGRQLSKDKNKFVPKMMSFPLGPYAIKLLDYHCRYDENEVIFPKVLTATTQFDRIGSAVRFVAKPDSI